MRAVLLLVAVAGCGRIGFDAAVGDDAHGIDSSMDTPTAVPCAGDVQVHTGADAELRSAIVNAPSGSTICIDDGLTVTLDNEVAIVQSLTIGGQASICGAGTSRLLRVNPEAKLHVRDLTLCHGRLTDSPGAAIVVTGNGELYLDNVTVTDNVINSETTYVEGGAIQVQEDAILEVHNSRFMANSAVVSNTTTGYARGGAIALGNSALTTGSLRVTITDTSFRGNSSTDVGGALFVQMDGANLVLDRLLFESNSSDFGAAMDINCLATGTIGVFSSTFSGNTAGTNSNGVIYVCDAASLDMSFDSFAGNVGYGVAFASSNGHVTWSGTAASTGAFALCTGLGTSQSLGFNVVDKADSLCQFSGANERIGDPGFSPLADNGGPTKTLALSPTSMAVDRGGPACPPIDQRGSARPNGAACDAGAFER